MSLFGNISMLSAAMRNYQAGLDVAANNVANALVPGYTRTRLQLSSLPVLTDGVMQYGTGATTTGIERLRNIFLDTQIKMQLSDLGRASARQIALQDLSAIFPEIAAPGSVSGIEGALANVKAKWAALAAVAASDPSPAFSAARTDVRDALVTFAERLNNDARLLNDLQLNLDLEVTNTITQISSLSDRIGLLNKQIISAKAAGMGHEPNPLLDARESAAQELSRLVGGSYRITANGSMAVSFNGGTLVDGSKVFHFKAMPSAKDPGRTAVGYYDNQQNIFIDVTAKISGGKLAGLLQARDIDAEDARLSLDKIAFGMIQRSNEINRTAVTSSGTNQFLFLGTKASDITVDPLLRTTNLNSIGATRDAAGDVANVQAMLQDHLMYSGIQTTPFTAINNPVAVPLPATATMAAIRGGNMTQVLPTAITFVASPAIPAGHLIIESGGNSVEVRWDDTTTINDVVAQINTQGGGAIQATYDQTSSKLYIYTNAPTAVWDEVGNLGKVLALSAVVTSSAPINNSPNSNYNGAVSAQTLNGVTNSLNLFTSPYPAKVPAGNYTTKFDNTLINWQPVNTFGAVVLSIQTTTPVGNRIYRQFNALQQVVTLVKTGDQAFNGGILTAANKMTSIVIGDQTGNLSRVLNFDTNETAGRIFSQLTTSINSRMVSEDVLSFQAQALVDQTQQLQDQNSAVDLNEEIAMANLYRRSYEASVRLQSIMDEMLNVLINHMGSSSSSSSGVI